MVHRYESISLHGKKKKHAIVRRLAKITVEFSSFKESVRSFLLVSRVRDQLYESRLAKTTSGTPLFLLNSRYGRRTVKTTGLYSRND
ncbi:hypothetical protein TSAR_009817, partial [Trichomalopsis sarcophagae]